MDNKPYSLDNKIWVWIINRMIRIIKIGQLDNKTKIRLGDSTKAFFYVN